MFMLNMAINYLNKMNENKGIETTGKIILIAVGIFIILELLILYKIIK